MALHPYDRITMDEKEVFMSEKLSNKTKIAYGVVGIGDAAFYCMICTFALFYFTTVAGINPALAGTIVAIGSIWDVIACSVIGYISDNFRSKYGKRKPFVLGAALPLALFSVMVFTAIDAGPALKAIYYTVMLMLVWTAYSAYYVPFTAWGAELTHGYNERTLLRGIVYMFYNGGAAIGMLLPTIIVDFLVGLGKSQASGWIWAAIICGSFASLTIILGAIFIKGSSTVDEEKEEKEKKTLSERLHLGIDIVKNYYQIFRMRAARFLILAGIFYLIGNAMMGANRMYFYTFNMGLSPKMISFVMALQLIVSTVLVPVIVKISTILDKRTASIFGFLITGVTMVIYGITGIPSIPHIIFFTTVYGIGSICYWQLVPSMMYDVCDADQLVNKEDRAGSIMAFQSLAESLSEAVGVQVLGIILSIAGFNGDLAVQSETAITGIHICLTFLPAVFIFLAMFMVIRYPISKKMYLKIRKAIDDRDAGKEVDLTEFSKLK